MTRRELTVVLTFVAHYWEPLVTDVRSQNSGL